jgi:lipid A 4'-phosphatase
MLMYLGVSKYFFITSFLLAILFIFVPQIDVTVSSLFFTSSEGFFWARQPIILFLYAIPKPIVAIAILALIILIIDLSFKKILLGIRPLVLFYFVAVMIIGPGLIVHTLLKDHWGRARPSQVTEFSGSKKFTPAFVIADQCKSNCSFVCGHAAGTFGLIPLALLVQYRRRRLALFAAITVGSLVGLARIIQGGHFLSDVIFSFVFVYLTAKILYTLTFEKHLFDFINKRVSA